MPIKQVLAGLAVSNVDAAHDFYQRLFGRPADARPMNGLLEWRVEGGGTVQVAEAPDRAGRSLLTLDCEALASELEQIAGRGLDPGPLDDSTSAKVLIAQIADPEGNAITLVEQR